MLPLKDNIPTDRFPVVTVVLIAINLLVFFGWQFPGGDDPGARGLSKGDQKVFELGAIPKEVTSPGTNCGPSGDEIRCAQNEDFGLAQPIVWLTILTSMFMHGGILHIGGNMLFLWIFGNNIEDAMGRGRFVLFYLLGGIAAVAAQVAIDPGSTIPTVGASGAIAAVLGAYMLLYPRARVLTAVLLFFFFTLIEIPAAIMLGIWFALQFLPAVGQLATPDVAGEGGGVAYFAHIGGFIFGLALIKAFANRRKDWQPEPRYPVY